MNVLKSIVVTIGIFGIVIFAVACGDDDEGYTTLPIANVGASVGGSAVDSAPPVSAASVQRAAASTLAGPAGTGTASAPQYAMGSTEAGIWVTGTGEMSLSPDIALVRLGVETTAPTVTKAREDAATAMEAVITAVKDNDLTDEDIQTTSFNIWPQYEYQEVVSGGVSSNKRVLTGYQVSNTVAIKIRDLDAVGKIIDDVATAGGDATRINGIDFSIEDPGAHTAQLREDAVNAALENAEHFATLTGVTLGKLVYITEVGGEVPIVQDFFAETRAFAMASAPLTPISSGSLDLTLTVQAGFAIW